MLIVVEQEEDNLTADIPGSCFRTFWNVLIQIAKNTNGRDYQEEEEHYIIINGTFTRLTHGYKIGWLICNCNTNEYVSTGHVIELQIGHKRQMLTIDADTAKKNIG